MEIPALKTLVTDIRSFNQKILDDSDKLSSVQGSGSATLEDLTKKLEQYTVETNDLENSIKAEIKPIADGLAAKSAQVDEMAEKTHMRNFRPEESAALISANFSNPRNLLRFFGPQWTVIFH